MQTALGKISFSTIALWFHGKKSRQEAEDILKNHGFDEGLFLVRHSSSCYGDFVLSVVVKEEIIHYQIQRRQKDALFSLSEETKVIHGLDELIYYYQNQPHSGLQRCGLQQRMGKSTDHSSFNQ